MSAGRGSRKKDDGKTAAISSDLLDIDVEALIQQAVEAATISIRTEITAQLNSTLVVLHKELQARENKLVELQEENTELKTQVQNQAQCIETLEIHERSDNLLVLGLPAFYAGILGTLLDEVQGPEEDEEKRCVDFCDVHLGVVISPSDIYICYRLPNSSMGIYPLYL